MAGFRVWSGLVLFVVSCGSGDPATPCPSYGGASSSSGAASPPSTVTPETSAAAVRITSFTADKNLVDFGQETDVRFTIEGPATDVTLDGVSVFGKTSVRVTPRRRHSFVLVARGTSSGDEKNVTIAARGIDIAAGEMASEGSLDGNATTTASIYQPMATVTDSQNTTWFTEASNCTLRKISAGVVTTVAGKVTACEVVDGKGDAAHFRQPSALTIDASTGTIYMIDEGAHTIRSVSPDGTVTTIAGSGVFGFKDGVGLNAQFKAPYGIVSMSNGDLLVADLASYVIRRITPNHTVTTPYGIVGQSLVVNSPGVPSFQFPLHLARDAADNVYVVDGCRIRKITPSNIVSTYAGAECVDSPQDGGRATARFGSISGLASDAQGNLYVGEADQRVVRRISATTDDVKTIAGHSYYPAEPFDAPTDGVGSYASFWQPAGLGARPDGTIIVIDFAASLVRTLTADGIVGTLAGQQPRWGWQDGALGANRVGPLVWLAEEPSTGDVLMADRSYNSVRRFDARTESITTIAGGSIVPATSDGVRSNARFGAPGGVTSDGAGGMFVLEVLGFVRHVDANGVVTTFTGNPRALKSIDGPKGVAAFENPFGMVRDSKGNLFVADNTAGRIRIVKADGSIDTFAGQQNLGQVLDGVGKQAQISRPVALAIDAHDNLFFADAGYVIRKAAPDGTVTTIAGMLNQFGHKDDEPTKSTFGFVSAIAVDANDNVFIADGDFVRKLSFATNTVTTIAGTANQRGLRAGPLPGVLFTPKSMMATKDGDLLLNVGSAIVRITAP